MRELVANGRYSAIPCGALAPALRFNLSFSWSPWRELGSSLELKQSMYIQPRISSPLNGPGIHWVSLRRSKSCAGFKSSFPRVSA
jgi:hypothetical protein